MFKSGFVNIIGAPNVGKSTLMNTLVGERLSIITSKAQTTRHRIMGIVTGDNYQIVFSDTPGVLKPVYKLHEKMMQFVTTAFLDADVFLIVVDIFEETMLTDDYIEKLNKQTRPILLLLNKCDLATDEQIEEARLKWKGIMPNAEIGAISALHKMNTITVMNKIIDLLPVGEPYYDREEFTDKPERFFVTEIIREKLLLQYRAEIPYSSEVMVHSFKDSENIIRIKADIIVERDSQKGIIIGNKGESIKQLGIASRTEAEKFFGKQIHLELFVKVDKDWRNNDAQLKRYGYDG